MTPEGIRALAIEAAYAPDRYDAVAALVDVATSAETPEDGRRAIRQFMGEYVERLRRMIRLETRKMKEELHQ
ncbi:MAG: hypothetical protein ACRDGB_15930 [Candidatus Limnocylindria bacterium]